VVSLVVKVEDGVDMMYMNLVTKTQKQESITTAK
jgi:hypothetical protein